MGDDIVTQLRAGGRSRPEPLLCDIAADEIERLRAAGDALVDAVERQQWSTVDVAIAVWKEASRG